MYGCDKENNILKNRKRVHCRMGCDGTYSNMPEYTVLSFFDEASLSIAGIEKHNKGFDAGNNRSGDGLYTAACL